MITGEGGRGGEGGEEGRGERGEDERGGEEKEGGGELIGKANPCHLHVYSISMDVHVQFRA